MFFFNALFKLVTAVLGYDLLHDIEIKPKACIVLLLTSYGIQTVKYSDHNFGMQPIWSDVRNKDKHQMLAALIRQSINQDFILWEL